MKILCQEWAISCELLAGDSVALQAIKAIAPAAGCMPELDGKSLLLKTLHTLTVDVEKLGWN